MASLVVTHQLQVKRRTGKVCQSETDVLPLCRVTNVRKRRHNLSCARGRGRSLLLTSNWPVSVGARPSRATTSARRSCCVPRSRCRSRRRRRRRASVSGGRRRPAAAAAGPRRRQRWPRRKARVAGRRPAAPRPGPPTRTGDGAAAGSASSGRNLGDATATVQQTIGYNDDRVV